MTLSEIGNVNEKDDSEINHGCRIVRLVPYLHQVGGHHCVLQYDDQTICKPFDEREFKCYTELPSDLKAFAPEYRGVWSDLHLSLSCIFDLFLILVQYLYLINILPELNVE